MESTFRSRGCIVYTYSGPVLVANANEEEILSLLCGCKKLKPLNGLNSVLAIQWSSSSLQYPCYMANWVEEIQSISSLMDFSFCHVFLNVIH